MDNPFENSGEPFKDDEFQTGGTKPAVTGETPVAPADDERSSIITARGTADGLVLRIDARVDATHLKEAVSNFVEARRSFLGNNEIALEWVGSKPDESLVQDLSVLLERKFGIAVRASRMKPQVLRTPSESERSPEPASPIKAPSEPAAPMGGFSVVTGAKAARPQSPSATLGSGSGSSKSLSLFDGIDTLEERPGTASSASALQWDEPDARVIYTTLRSGQKVETEHSVVIFGDVNSGAEVIAGGDIIVLGTLRGIAHAGAYDETGGGRVIFCLNMQPTQLRIGTVISRGIADDRANEGPRGSEIARVQNNLIVVEPYQSRGVWGRRRE